ncbi:hypothetical protein FOCG_12189 [Fusarium oxysporum f. sp. radicis-lycopersici 26381]|uniref:Uncharacterized protein n=1 Tax=Fusarium oxysporum Fo47 TaxID=660027 RepID=W9KY66_FUSOX|nr:hypothetical protein FOZG_00354 [Fusarium oxysporum Fo47]EXL46238.1 hypothetical protein FOCG_12189 [Fusarium oxysporum f. sp. radicis-lycopersici 26381]
MTSAVKVSRYGLRKKIDQHPAKADESLLLAHDLPRNSQKFGHLIDYLRHPSVDQVNCRGKSRLSATNQDPGDA